MLKHILRTEFLRNNLDGVQSQWIVEICLFSNRTNFPGNPALIICLRCSTTIKFVFLSVEVYGVSLNETDRPIDLYPVFTENNILPPTTIYVGGRTLFSKWQPIAKLYLRLFYLVVSLEGH